MFKSGSYLSCPNCGRTWEPNYSTNSNDEDDDYYEDNDLYRYNGYNETYHREYEGTDQDLGEDWDYDEYPPENL